MRKLSFVRPVWRSRWRSSDGPVSALSSGLSDPDCGQEGSEYLEEKPFKRVFGMTILFRMDV